MRLTPGTEIGIAARQRTGCERTFGSNPALLPKLGLVGRPGFWRRPRKLKAIRILQAHGLPLSRIQQLLFGRPDAELEQIAESAGEIGPLTPNVRSDPLGSQEKWTTYPLNKQLFLVAREGARLSASQIEAIRKICDHPHKQSSKLR